MAKLAIKPLDSADGYLRWNESVLLGLNTAGVAHVLSDDPPPALALAPAPPATTALIRQPRSSGRARKKWYLGLQSSRLPPPLILASLQRATDTVCRGHILGTLSDRLLPVYVRHATARVLWQAVARTYEPDYYSWELMFEELEFGDDETLRERVAHVEALAIAKSRFPEPCYESVAYYVCTKLPEVAKDAITEGYGTSMAGLWRSALEMERICNDNDLQASRGTTMARQDKVQHPVC
ncbi:unnamed protein product [Urochloa decumbens]|uniref:Uncharacterized protein n=1 Tax=Urochloa decumbens TaxID=240449 RepID=A0ABC9BFV8_9POAL